MNSPSEKSISGYCTFCKAQPAVFCVVPVPTVVEFDGEWVLGQETTTERLCPSCCREYRDFIVERLQLPDPKPVK